MATLAPRLRRSCQLAKQVVRLQVPASYKSAEVMPLSVFGIAILRCGHRDSDGRVVRKRQQSEACCSVVVAIGHRCRAVSSTPGRPRFVSLSVPRHARQGGPLEAHPARQAAISYGLIRSQACRPPEETKLPQFRTAIHEAKWLNQGQRVPSWSTNWSDSGKLFYGIVPASDSNRE